MHKFIKVYIFIYTSKGLCLCISVAPPLEKGLKLDKSCCMELCRVVSKGNRGLGGGNWVSWTAAPTQEYNTTDEGIQGPTSAT